MVETGTITVRYLRGNEVNDIFEIEIRVRENVMTTTRTYPKSMNNSLDVLNDIVNEIDI